MSIFEAKNISKKYGKRVIIDGADFHINSGDIVAICGPNAGGKSTLLKILSGTIKPDGGNVYNDGKELVNSKDFSTAIGYVPQSNPLFEDLTVEDNLKFWASGKNGGYKKLKESGVIERMKIQDYLKYKVSKLSGGLQKRVSIACVISETPDVLILDEPGASLDVIFKEELKSFMLDYAANGGSVIIVSHEEGELSIATRMYIMANTKLKELDKVANCNELKEIISK